MLFNYIPCSPENKKNNVPLFLNEGIAKQKRAFLKVSPPIYVVVHDAVMLSKKHPKEQCCERGGTNK